MYITKTKEGTRGNPPHRDPQLRSPFIQYSTVKVEPSLIFLSSELQNTPVSDII